MQALSKLTKVHNTGQRDARVEMFVCWCDVALCLVIWYVVSVTFVRWFPDFCGGILLVGKTCTHARMHECTHAQWIGLRFTNDKKLRGFSAKILCLNLISRSVLNTSCFHSVTTELRYIYHCISLFCMFWALSIKADKLTVFGCNRLMLLYQRARICGVRLGRSLGNCDDTHALWPLLKANRNDIQFLDHFLCRSSRQWDDWPSYPFS